MRRVRTTPQSDRCVIAARVLRAMALGIAVQINDEPRGRVARIANGWRPQRPLGEGGSTLIAVFEDGRSIPVENVERIGRQQ